MGALSLDIENLKRLAKYGSFQIPKVITSRCEECGNKSNFPIIESSSGGGKKGMGFVSRCPGCEHQSIFFIVFSDSPKEDGFYYPEAAYHHFGKRAPIGKPVLSGDVSPKLVSSLNATIDAYNEENYVATAVMGRRTLEGLFKHLVPEEKKELTLHKLVDSVAQNNRLADPLFDLAKAVRSGGNLGAHFDPEREPDELMARKIVELVKYLTDYLYTLPNEIRNLEASIEFEPIEMEALIEIVPIEIEGEESS